MKKLFQCPQCKAILTFDDNIAGKPRCPKCSFIGEKTAFKEIPTRKLWCPSCNTALSVQVREGNQNIKCPKCQYANDSSLFLETPKSQPQPKPQQVSNIESATELPTDIQNQYKMYKPGILVLVEGDCADESIELKRGINTIGRMSPNSKNSIQLNASDPYMSKNHAIIDVIMQKDRTFEHRLSDNNSKNHTCHNGIKLESGDAVILSRNDTIRMGHTTFKFLTE
ncbi:MAG: FHA domain-containing protein [Tannerella sp.]|jgi:DNA-directed RNA polymerase subunit M/transcription elongation factor TFIIS|nr:FHA domain-containing protein [Tannerella sp.]